MKQHIFEREILKMTDEQVVKLMLLTWGGEITKELLEYRIKKYKKYKMFSKLLSLDLTIGKMIEGFQEVD